MKEQESRKEVVGIDSFATYINNTMQAIRGSPSLRIEPFENALPKNNVDRVRELDQEPRKKHGSTREKIVIGDIPWDSIPESLQEILGLQYPASTLKERKTVNITLETDALLFMLNSINSRSGIDRYGDIYSPYGLILRITDKDSKHNKHFDPKGLTGRKGDFVIYKVPLAEQIRDDVLMRKIIKGESLTQEEEEWQENNLRKKMSFGNLQVVPSSLVHLQDIASVVEKFKNNTILFTDKGFKTI